MSGKVCAFKERGLISTFPNRNVRYLKTTFFVFSTFAFAFLLLLRDVEGEADVVHARPQGQRRLYELHPEGMLELFGWIAPYQRLWRGSLDALERHLDKED